MSWLAAAWLDVLGGGGSALRVFSLLQAKSSCSARSTSACPVLVPNAMVAVWPMVAINAVGSRCRGFCRVVTPTGMVGGYYDKVGLRCEGDRYALDL